MKHFGGRISPVNDAQWKATLEGTFQPIPIRGKLIICGNQTAYASSLDSQKSLERKAENGRRITNKRTSKAIPLYFPAEMAFGSGSHATTASCLRILCDLQRSLQPGWNLLDLGTGSGILAIAASALGAGEVLAVDFDPVAIRIARSNWRRNRDVIKKREALRFEVVDVRENFPSGKYRVICANLFAGLLMKIVSDVFQSLERGGWWIFSGVLTEQLSEVVSALREGGFSAPTIRHRGKWIAGVAQKPLT